MAGIQHKALGLLGHIADKGERSAIDGVSSHLSSPKNGVRKMAMRGLVQMAQKNDSYTIQSVVRHLDNEEMPVRQDAVRAVRQVASPENTRKMLPVARVWAVGDVHIPGEKSGWR